MNQTYIIAEMASSHEGDPNLGRVIIDGAGKAQANAVQLQIWLAEDMMVPHHKDYPVLERIQLSREAWAGLATFAREHYPTMHLIACVYERKSVDFAETIGVDAYKLHSADLSNPYLVKYVAQTNKRIDLSVGASTIGEIQTAIEWIREVSNAPIWMMYGYQNFPTPTDAIHLDYMLKLKNLFELPVGYQDHSDADSLAAFWLPAAAVGMDIHIQEKHITHNRALKGIDHQSALNPDEFAKFVAMVREIDVAKGSATPRGFSPEELKYRKYSKKSIVSKHALTAGQVITDDDLLFMRAPELGLPPDQAPKLVGRVLKHALEAYQLVTEGDVE